MEAIKVRRFLGGIVLVSVVGMLGVKYYTNADLDGYILPFILLVFGISLIFNKTKEEAPMVKLNPRYRNLVLVLAALAVLAGVLVSFYTL